VLANRLVRHHGAARFAVHEELIGIRAGQLLDDRRNVQQVVDIRAPMSARPSAPPLPRYIGATTMNPADASR